MSIASLKTYFGERVGTIDVVKDCKADPTGQTDSTLAIQTAVNQAVTGKLRSVDLPAGTFKITDTITVPDGESVFIRGQGRHATRLVQFNSSKGGIKFYNTELTTGGGVEDMSIQANGPWNQTNSSGIGIRARALNDNFGVSRVSIENFAIGIQESWCWYPTWHDIRIMYANSRGIYLATDGDNFGGGAHYEKIKIHDGDMVGDKNGSVGFYIEQTGGLFMDTIDIVHLGVAVMVKPPSNKQAAYIWANSVLGDTSLYDNWVIDGTAGKVVSMNCVNCWGAYSLGGTGLVLKGNGVNSFGWTGGRLRENYVYGMLLQSGVRNVTLASSFVECNSTQQDGMHQGVQADAGVGRFRIIGNRIGRDASGFNTRHDNGVRIAPGNSNNYIVALNDFYDNFNGGVFDSGTGTQKYIGGNTYA